MINNKVVLGIRNSPQGIRYAILELSQGKIILKNPNVIDNYLPFPKSSESHFKKLKWLYEELEMIRTKYPDFSEVMIKINEYARSDSIPLRLTAYLDAVVMLFFTQKNIPIQCKVYKSLGSKSADVLTQAKSLVGRTDSKWDTKIADAIVAAHSLLSIDQNNYVQ
jgi:hypothetical protein